MNSVRKPRTCRYCGDVINRSGPLAPRVCVGCWKARQVRPKIVRSTPVYTLTRAANTGPREPVAPIRAPGLYRSRKLLDLAHKVQACMNCERACPDGCEPAHENGTASGKGMSLKSPDNRHAALCHDCHSWLDQSGTHRDPSGVYHATRAEKREMWQRAHARTMDHYFYNEWIKVAA